MREHTPQGWIVAGLAVSFGTAFALVHLRAFAQVLADILVGHDSQ